MTGGDDTTGNKAAGEGRKGSGGNAGAKASAAEAGVRGRCSEAGGSVREALRGVGERRDGQRSLERLGFAHTQRVVMGAAMSSRIREGSAGSTHQLSPGSGGFEALEADGRGGGSAEARFL